VTHSARWRGGSDRWASARKAETNRWDPAAAIFQFPKTSKIPFLRKKNRYKVRKNLRKIMEVGNEIWNTFHNRHFFQIFMDFELIKRF
jgi:CelD/BcsL family acetyltransferase involved in cellulose biosynthesis